MQFNMFQYSMRLNKLNNIGLVTGLGLEYQRFRFANKNSIERGEGGQIYPMEVENVKKSSFKNLYLPYLLSLNGNSRLRNTNVPTWQPE